MDNSLRFEEEIISNIKKLLKKKGLTQSELSKAIGEKHATTLTEVFKGRTRLSVVRLYEIAQVLGVPAIALCGNSHDRRLINRDVIGDVGKDKNSELVKLMGLLKDKPADDIIFIRKYIEKRLL